MENKSSMLYWYPKIKDLDIPQPKTIVLEFLGYTSGDWCGFVDDGFPKDMIAKIKVACKEFGYPVFIRTDSASGKHDWKKSCFVESEDKLVGNLSRVVEFNLIASIMGLPMNAIIVREYVPMKNLFTAFYGEMPVNPEIRFFAKDGEILCKHWYWIEEAITNPSVKNWKEIMKKEKKSLEGRKDLFLFDKALRVASEFKGCWSIDFCKSKDGIWYLIDMAVGNESWHPENCSNHKKIMEK